MTKDACDIKASALQNMHICMHAILVPGCQPAYMFPSNWSYTGVQAWHTVCHNDSSMTTLYSDASTAYTRACHCIQAASPSCNHPTLSDHMHGCSCLCTCSCLCACVHASMQAAVAAGDFAKAMDIYANGSNSVSGRSKRNFQVGNACQPIIQHEAGSVCERI